MPEVFERAFQQRDFSAENIAILRDAYVIASDKLGISASMEDKLALVKIIQQLANLEPFRKAEHMASLAIEWYRSRQ